MTFDLRSRYLGLDLAHPIVASSSPLTGDLDSLKRLEEAGAAAVVLPSLFEEQIERDELELHHALELGAHSHGEAVSYLPEPEEHDSVPDRYLELVRAAKEALAIPVIASLNGVTDAGWLRYADLLQSAGADAIELNVYAVETDPYTFAAAVEERLLRLVTHLRTTTTLPLAVKISPHYTALANVASRLGEMGVDGLVLFNRFLQPDLDLETLSVKPVLHLSNAEELGLPLRWIAILAGRLPLSLAATTGVQRAADAVKLVLVGADVVMVASEALRRGPVVITELRDGLARWLEEHEYASLEQAKGSMSQAGCGDPYAFERAQYVRTLLEQPGR